MFLECHSVTMKIGVGKFITDYQLFIVGPKIFTEQFGKLKKLMSRGHKSVKPLLRITSQQSVNNIYTYFKWIRNVLELKIVIYFGKESFRSKGVKSDH